MKSAFVGEIKNIYFAGNSSKRAAMRAKFLHDRPFCSVLCTITVTSSKAVSLNSINFWRWKLVSVICVRFAMDSEIWTWGWSYSGWDWEKCDALYITWCPCLYITWCPYFCFNNITYYISTICNLMVATCFSYFKFVIIIPFTNKKSNSLQIMIHFLVIPGIRWTPSYVQV